MFCEWFPSNMSTNTTVTWQFLTKPAITLPDSNHTAQHTYTTDIEQSRQHGEMPNRSWYQTTADIIKSTAGKRYDHKIQSSNLPDDGPQIVLVAAL